MKVKFSTKQLEEVFNNQEVIKSKLPLAVVKSYCKAVAFIKATDSIISIYRSTWYHLEKYNGHYSMRLNEQWRLEIEIIKDELQVISILQISNHYKQIFR